MNVHLRICWHLRIHKFLKLKITTTNNEDENKGRND